MAIIPEPYRRRDYRGLNDAEDRLTLRYLDRRDPDIQTMETRVRVGPGDTVGRPSSDELQRAWQAATQFKIDLLFELPNSYRIVELKDHIRTAGIGQVLAYDYWLRNDRDLDKPVELELASESINPTAVRPARFRNIRLVPLSEEAERKIDLGLSAGRQLVGE